MTSVRAGHEDVEALVEKVQRALDLVGVTKPDGIADEADAALASLVAVVTGLREALQTIADSDWQNGPLRPSQGVRDFARAALAASAGGEDG